jgi:hypothetical protein
MKMQMKYKCVFPNCDYETDNRALMEFHHINPKELKVKLNKDIEIPLCPNHHKLIFHPETKSGQHSRQYDNSLSVVQVTNTTTGQAVIFKDIDGREITVFVDVRHPKADAIYDLKWSPLSGIVETEPEEVDSYVESQVDAKGYCQVENHVYFSPGNRHFAQELLKQYITQYMIRAKNEYEKFLERARNDWKSL